MTPADVVNALNKITRTKKLKEYSSIIDFHPFVHNQD